MRDCPIEDETMVEPVADMNGHEIHEERGEYIDALKAELKERVELLEFSTAPTYITCEHEYQDCAECPYVHRRQGGQCDQCPICGGCAEE
jgi:hypothetical protein